jgi:hypothetical protein
MIGSKSNKLHPNDQITMKPNRKNLKKLVWFLTILLTFTVLAFDSNNYLSAENLTRLVKLHFKSNIVCD